MNGRLDPKIARPLRLCLPGTGSRDRRRRSRYVSRDFAPAPGPCRPAVPNCRGFIVNYAWQSDSGTKADLDQAQLSERIEATGTGVLATFKLTTGCYLSAAGGMNDSHQVGADHLDSSGTFTGKQTFMLKDNRSGAPSGSTGPINHRGNPRT
jgi:hypothetical protein